jgi:two-component system chemotaxis sensor kinase CheA
MGTEIDVSQYLDVFLEETKEHLQAFTQALIDLEGSDAERATEALNEAFRAAHTVKSMSASMDFRNMEHLCHSTEDVMDELRSGSRSVTPEIIDLLLECSTKLKKMEKVREREKQWEMKIAKFKMKNLKRWRRKGGEVKHTR